MAITKDVGKMQGSALGGLIGNLALGALTGGASAALGLGAAPLAAAGAVKAPMGAANAFQGLANSGSAIANKLGVSPNLKPPVQLNAMKYRLYGG